MVNYQKKDCYSLDDLLWIMEKLRGPDGCPWDREQTHASVRANVIEEAYEAAEAIDRRDPAMLCEELGDLLLQVVFHARMANEAGEFTFDNVTDGICRKLIERHPHVFGSERAETADQVLTRWDAIKRRTKGQGTLSAALDGVAHSLPALTRAAKMVDKLRKAGAFECPDPGAGMGQTLLAGVAEARAAGVDPEDALQRECDRLIQRQVGAEQGGRV